MIDKASVDEIAEGVARGIRQAESEKAYLEAWASQNPPDNGEGIVAVIVAVMLLVLIWWLS